MTTNYCDDTYGTAFICFYTRMYVCIRVKSFYAFSYAVCTKIHCTKTGDDCTQERMYGTDLNIFRVPVTLR